MAKPEWGIKRICSSCGARYYDLHRRPPVCPSCGAEFDPEAFLKSRRARPAAVEEVKKAAPPSRAAAVLGVGVDEVVDLEDAEDGVPVEDLEEDGEEEDVLIEDASELGEDDDMGEVVDVEASVDDDGGR